MYLGLDEFEEVVVSYSGRFKSKVVTSVALRFSITIAVSSNLEILGRVNVLCRLSWCMYVVWLAYYVDSWIYILIIFCVVSGVFLHKY